jgi:hypothetical protein
LLKGTRVSRSRSETKRPPSRRAASSACTVFRRSPLIAPSPSARPRACVPAALRLRSGPKSCTPAQPPGFLDVDLRRVEARLVVQHRRQQLRQVMRLAVGHAVGHHRVRRCMRLTQAATRNWPIPPRSARPAAGAVVAERGAQLSALLGGRGIAQQLA